MIESKKKSYSKGLSLPSASFPEVNISDKFCQNYGVHEGTDVTSNYYADRGAIIISPIKDLNIYNIKDHSIGNYEKKTAKKICGRLHRSNLKTQQVTASRRESPSLLEQSRSLQGFRKQITNRLSENESDALLGTKPFTKKLLPLSPNERITTKLSGVAGFDVQTSTKTVFLKNRGIHVRVTETPKEAMARQIRQSISRSSSSLLREQPPDDTRLIVHGVVSGRTNYLEDKKKSEISSYAIRQQYGQHLEKNWYKSLIRKMNTKNKESVTKQDYPFTPEIFYSPEPESDNDAEDDCNWNGNFKVTVDDYSGKVTSESDSDFQSSRGDDPSLLIIQSTRFASMDVLVSDCESDDGSDIEFVLKNGNLIQKRVKNKMLKKRQRQFDRFQKSTQNVKEESEGDANLEFENMSDKELRALRLKLKKPKWKLKLRGKARFRQVARCIGILIYFKRLMKQLKKDRRERMKQNKRHKSLGGFLSGEEDDFGRFQGNQTKYRTLKERFLSEIGWKLVEEVSNLAIRDGFGYDIQEELASGERKSRYLRLLEGWFPEESPESLEIKYIPRRISERSTIIRTHKRSNSCPELIQPKQYRVLFGPNNVSASEEISTEASRKSGKKGNKKLKKSQMNLRSSKNNYKADEYAIGEHPGSGRRSSFELNREKNGLMDLRDLLKDVNIPAKEIKIQIAERKMRRNKRNGRQTKKKNYVPYDAKKAIEANRFKIPDFTLDLQLTNNSPEQDDMKSEATSSPEQITNSPTNPNATAEKLRNFTVRNGPFVSSSVSWNKSKQQKQNTWTNEELDQEIHKAGSLFLEMRHCRYIRWDRLGQAMVSRMLELENEIMYGFSSKIREECKM